MEVTRRRGRRRKKLLDDLKDRRGYSHLKEEAVDCTMWRNRFRGGFGPVVRQNTEWMNFSRYLASGCNFHDLRFSYRIGISAASKTVRAVCLSIWSIMRPECIPKPTKQQWELTALEFEKTAKFSHCLGAVDGNHIRVIKPEHNGSMFYNYKDFFSVVL